ncbi:hypothetical protein PINS_up013852 [Pythium insidiosum]|nr:hypothetical protein PINS_up013852 [Pythium insidiosum]
MTGLSTAPSNPYVFTREEYDSLVAKMPHPVISARSEYEEVELVEDCTLYDIYRQPRQPVTSPEVTRTLPVRVLNADLTCPICLGIIRNTEVVMECLHRFCGDCIQKCLRVGKNECPSCRIHIPSKRSLRKDTNFDELIAKIYPNLDEFQSQEEKLIEEINRTRHFNNALTQSTKMGVQSQQTMRRNGSKKRSPSDPPSSESSSPTTGSSENGSIRTSWSGAQSETNGSGASTASCLRIDRRI